MTRPRNDALRRDRRRRRREDLFRPMLAALVAGTFVIAFLSWGVLHVAGEALDNTKRLDRAEKCARVIASLFRQSTNRNGAIIYVVLDSADQERDDGDRVKFGELAALPELQPAPVDCRKRTIKIPRPIKFKDLPASELEAIGDAELGRLLREHKARAANP